VFVCNAFAQQTHPKKKKVPRKLFRKYTLATAKTTENQKDSETRLLLVWGGDWGTDNLIFYLNINNESRAFKVTAHSWLLSIISCTIF
jgi:hypothetical protein